MDRTNNAEIIPPEYTEYPREDDSDNLIEEIDEGNEDRRIEELLREQEKLKDKTTRNMDAPFTGTGYPTYQGGSNNNNNTPQIAPWERGNNNTGNNNNQQGIGGNIHVPLPSWGSSWSSINNGGNQPKTGYTPTWGGQQNSGTQQKQSDLTVNSKQKKIVICDALDCLVESYDSNGKPGVMPRAIFDLKPKFNVWEKLASFNPTKLYIIFPAEGLVPSFGDTNSTVVALEYVAYSIATYLRLPRRNCLILKQMKQGIPKEHAIASLLNEESPDPSDIVYVGVRSGKWGLSSQDKDAAKALGIDYIDMFNLLNGLYLYE